MTLPPALHPPAVLAAGSDVTAGAALDAAGAWRQQQRLAALRAAALAAPPADAAPALLLRALAGAAALLLRQRDDDDDDDDDGAKWDSDVDGAARFVRAAVDQVSAAAAAKAKAAAHGDNNNNNGAAAASSASSAFCWSYVATSLVLAASPDQRLNDPWGPAAVWRKMQQEPDDGSARRRAASAALLAELGLGAHAAEALRRLGGSPECLARLVSAHPLLAPGALAALGPLSAPAPGAQQQQQQQEGLRWFSAVVDAAAGGSVLPPPSPSSRHDGQDRCLSDLAAGLEPVLRNWTPPFVQAGGTKSDDGDDDDDASDPAMRAARLVEAALCERQALATGAVSAQPLRALRALQGAVQAAMARGGGSPPKALLHLSLRLTLFLASATDDGKDDDDDDDAPPAAVATTASWRDALLSDPFAAEADNSGDALEAEPAWMRAIRQPAVLVGGGGGGVRDIAARLGSASTRRPLANDAAASDTATAAAMTLLAAAWQQAPAQGSRPLPPVSLALLEHHLAGSLAALLAPGAAMGVVAASEQGNAPCPGAAFASAASVCVAAGADNLAPVRLAAALLGALLQVPSGGGEGAKATEDLTLLLTCLHARMLSRCMRAAPLGVEEQRALLSLALAATAAAGDTHLLLLLLLPAARRALVAASNRLVVDRRALAAEEDDTSASATAAAAAVALTPAQRAERVALAARPLLAPTALFPREALRRVLADALAHPGRQAAVVHLLSGPLRPLLPALPRELGALIFGGGGDGEDDDDGVRSAGEADSAAELAGRLAAAGILLLQTPAGLEDIAIAPLERALERGTEDAHVRAGVGVCERLLPLLLLLPSAAQAGSNPSLLPLQPRLLLALARASAFARRRSVCGGGGGAGPSCASVAQASRVLEAAVGRLATAKDQAASAGQLPSMLLLPWRVRAAVLPALGSFITGAGQPPPLPEVALGLVPLPPVEEEEQEQGDNEEEQEQEPLPLPLLRALSRALDFAASADAHAQALEKALAASPDHNTPASRVALAVASAVADAAAHAAPSRGGEGDGGAAAAAVRAALVRALARWLPHASPEQARRALCVVLPSLVGAALRQAADLEPSMLLPLAAEAARRAVLSSSSSASSSSSSTRHFAAFLAGVSGVDGGQGLQHAAPSLRTVHLCLREACRLSAALAAAAGATTAVAAAAAATDAAFAATGPEQRALGALIVQLCAASARAAAPAFVKGQHYSATDDLSAAWMALGMDEDADAEEGGGERGGFVARALAPCAAALRRLQGGDLDGTAAAALATLASSASRRVAEVALASLGEETAWEDEDASAEALEDLLNGGE